MFSQKIGKPTKRQSPNSIVSCSLVASIERQTFAEDHRCVVFYRPLDVVERRDDINLLTATRAARRSNVSISPRRRWPHCSTPPQPPPLDISSVDSSRLAPYPPEFWSDRGNHRRALDVRLSSTCVKGVPTRFRRQTLDSSPYGGAMPLAFAIGSTDSSRIYIGTRQINFIMHGVCRYCHTKL